MTEAKTRRVELFDTSLRDGLQQPNLDISVQNAVMLLQRMELLACATRRSALPANQFVSDLTGALASSIPAA